ncbi:DUF3558 domain-containing protein [Rhodococcus ruber]|uniref:DUF3558 domain-containing protein n=1 Tax=Rhodococcus ruber TaxID=1830 RepID=A0A098BV22_9NOCA|nr:MULTISPECIES: DUF3558 domain-containing protein [Rhodococcus]MCD2129411.1 DUF3558 domain-containing protein [Rhodococcus ruber]MCZ1071476.1 DUF3558 domain-containing protein [Rhodococcus sp. A5(2022)]MCZ4505845.1 DUF3558 domain-containing protein [Rhodococcus ruber]MCZ4533043.1 DUF3558 domain-containing protein [Rhodococcus ruber]MCZ4623463.1 DUF3558 domain-containing protein [Rhodococcus ruber]
MTGRRTAGGLLAVGVLAGCAVPSHSAITTSEPPTPVTTTTRVPRLVDESDRPLVAFDPCLDIPDEVLTAAGYDPRTEDNADFAATHFTMLGCSYDGIVHIPGILANYGLSVLSANFDFEEERQKATGNGDDMVLTELAGRRALLKTNTSLPYRCGMSVETSYGVLIFGRIHFRDSSAPLPESQWCVGLEDTVGRIVAVLDDFESTSR